MSRCQVLKNMSLPVLMLGLAIGGASPSAEDNKAPQGLSASDWGSIRQEYERNRHAVFQEAGEYRARNHAQQWLTRFDGRGFVVEPDGAGWRWGLELESYGFSERRRVTNRRPRVTAAKERVRYRWDEVVEEWFVNDHRGLEHGFTLRRRPSGQAQEPGPLVVSLAVRGGLGARVQVDGTGVSFVDPDGHAVVQYAGLKVWDADGKVLPARFEPVDDGLRLEIDETDARYPIAIDPIAQQAYLKASNTEASDNFGKAVTVSGDTVVVGAPAEDSNATGVNGDQSNNSALGSGAAYVFVRTGAVWSQQAYLKASNTDAADAFGTSLAISGDTLVVGAPGESSNATGVNGTETDDSAAGAGAAYVFVRSAGVWSQQAYLKASNSEASDGFGNMVAISGETVLVGAVNEDSSATGVNGNASDNGAVSSGAAYVFVRSGSVWSQQAYLKASNTEAVDHFAASGAVSGDTLVVGASDEDSGATGVNGNQSDNTQSASGAAYVYVRTAGAWSQQAYLKASNTEAFDVFGISVAVSGDTVLVGAYQEDSGSGGVNGNQADESATNAGAAYVFTRSGGAWSQQAYLKASSPVAIDAFGVAVALSADTAVVGVFSDNNSASDSGAVYVFTRTGAVWSQSAFLKASNPGSSDLFGNAVALSNDTVVVGAYLEDSAATGIHGNQADDSASSAGAAYVFFMPPCVFTVTAEPAPSDLLPADHRLVEVTVTIKINPCVSNPKVKLVSIKSDEPDTGTGPGDLPKDIQQANFGTDDRKFLLRAERRPPVGPPKVIDSKHPPGRRYVLNYQVTDSNGGKKILTPVVFVPQ